MLRPGDPAPDFTLMDDEGRAVRLANLRGRPVVLYFYPADFTPGCTLETRAFAARHGEFEARQASVFGVSANDGASHRAFAKECGAPFHLLTDPGGAVFRAYGGVGWFGIHRRLTVVIAPDGRVAGGWSSHLRPEGHPEAALRILDPR